MAITVLTYVSPDGSTTRRKGYTSRSRALAVAREQMSAAADEDRTLTNLSVAALDQTGRTAVNRHKWMLEDA